MGALDPRLSSAHVPRTPLGSQQLRRRAEILRISRALDTARQPGKLQVIARKGCSL